MLFFGLGFFFFSPSGKEEGKHLSSVFWFLLLLCRQCCSQIQGVPRELLCLCRTARRCYRGFCRKSGRFSKCVQHLVLVVDRPQFNNSCFLSSPPQVSCLEEMLFTVLSPRHPLEQLNPTQTCICACTRSACIH